MSNNSSSMLKIPENNSEPLIHLPIAPGECKHFHAIQEIRSKERNDRNDITEPEDKPKIKIKYTDGDKVVRYDKVSSVSTNDKNKSVDIVVNGKTVDVPNSTEIKVVTTGEGQPTAVVINTSNHSLSEFSSVITFVITYIALFLLLNLIDTIARIRTKQAPSFKALRDNLFFPVIAIVSFCMVIYRVMLLIHDRYNKRV